MDYTATARVWDATSTAASSQSTSTADYAAVQAYATQQYADAKQAELTNKTRALVPWAMLITLFIAVIALGKN